MPERSVAPGGLGRRTKEATMTTTLLALVLLCLMTGTAMAQQPKVTSLMSKDLPENPGSEVPDDHSRACAQRVEPHPPTQCPCDCLRTGASVDTSKPAIRRRRKTGHRSGRSSGCVVARSRLRAQGAVSGDTTIAPTSEIVAL